MNGYYTYTRIKWDDTPLYDPQIDSIISLCECDKRFRKRVIKLLDKCQAFKIHNMTIHPSDILLDEYYKEFERLAKPSPFERIRRWIS